MANQGKSIDEISNVTGMSQKKKSNQLSSITDVLKLSTS